MDALAATLSLVFADHDHETVRQALYRAFPDKFDVTYRGIPTQASLSYAEATVVEALGYADGSSGIGVLAARNLNMKLRNVLITIQTLRREYGK